MIEKLPADVLEPLLNEAGLASDNVVCTPIEGGLNNRVYRLDANDGPVLLKHYFPDGDWDRLAAESRFLLFCARAGIRRAPRLLAESRRDGLALHSWFAGTRPKPEALRPDDVEAAAVFLGELAAASRRNNPDFPPARDAYRCPEDYFRSPRERLAALEQALRGEPDSPLAAEALSFVLGHLKPAWERACTSTLAGLTEKALFQPFPVDMLIVSPSDFGFHNSLRLEAEHDFGFVDFEYAGLDDPGKAICDFVCQPTFPPPSVALDRLAEAVYDDHDAVEKLKHRVRTFLPINRIKFCCIILNDFKGLDARRRGFALSPPSPERLAAQLAKAKRYLETANAC